MTHDQHLSKLVQVRDRNRETIGRTTAEFQICRLYDRTDPLKIIPERDAFEPCARCGRAVVFDRSHSQGVPHICVDCAISLRRKVFQPFESDPVTPDKLGDPEQYARLMTSISQSRSGEHKVNLPNQPRHERVNVPQRLL